MRRFLYALLVVFLFSTLHMSPVAAQGRGTVAGTVKDQANATLSSALVELLPLGRRAVSNDQGQFLISDVPAGEYTLSVSYVGFSTVTATIKVEAGQTVNIDPVLKVASQAEEVLVTAERVQGEAEAINIEKMSDNIVQVLPERVINSLPNTNIADAVGRLPSVSLERDEGEGKYVQIRGTEPRLTSVTINGVNTPSVEGNVRNIKLDSVPADLVERIEVFKTLSAEQDADGIGGTVNLVTRSAGEKATYSFGGTTGYNPLQNGFWRGGFNGVAGKRFGTNKKLGILFNGTFDETNRGIDDMEPAEVPAIFQGKEVAYTNTVDYRSYNYYRKRYGFSLGADYVLKPGSNFYIKGLDSDFHDFGETWVYTPNAGNLVSVNGSHYTFDNTGSYQYRHYIRRPDQAILSILAGGHHDLGANVFSYEFAGSRSHNIGGQDFATTNFNGSQNATLALDATDPLRPKFSSLDGSNLYDATQYTVTHTEFPRYHATQVNFQGAASWSRRYSLGSHLSTFQMGVKVRDSHSTQTQLDSFYDATGSNPFTLSSVVGTFTNPTYYDGSFAWNGQDYGPTSSYSQIIQSLQSTLGSQFKLNGNKGIIRDAGAFYDADERIYAGFLQDSITLGKFRVQGGVRFDAATTGFTTHSVDKSVMDASGNLIVPATLKSCPDPSSSICIFRQNSDYFNALPSVQVQYQVQPDTQIRGVFSQGISRPNIGDLVPTTIVDPNASPKSVSLGNPNLKPTKADNYDLLAEHYFRSLGILQAGFFYKHLSNPIYSTAQFLNSGALAGYLQTQSINGPNAHITGFEAAWEQRFSFLPSFLSGFGVAANYSYTNSQVTFPANFSAATAGGQGRIDHPTLQRQAPNNWNAGFTYDKARFSMRFAVSHNDASIFQYAYLHTDAPTDQDPVFGLKGPTGDIYLYAHTQFDIQGSYRFAKGFSFQMSGLNLSNEVFGFYQGSGRYPIQREYYKPTVSFGFRWTSTNE